jgi:protein-S-isoprenylcysteine O-methyltransferase Ste14
VETPEGDGAAVRLPPPLVYLLAVLVGVLLHLIVYPLRLDLALGPRIGLAGAAALVGIGLVGAALGLFRRTGQDPKPWASTPEIISTGVYRFTRNPMYIGMALVQAAIGIGAANGWILALAPVSLVIVYFIAVRHEEAYLEGKFGAGYIEYTKTVRRWL